MRLKIKMVPSNGKQLMEIPLDFRRHFISLIKSILSGSNVFDRFKQDKPGYSPYVFSVSFNKIYGYDQKKQTMVIKTPVYMTISSGIFEVITAICNGAIKLKNKDIVLGLKLADINIQPFQRNNKSQAVFRIQGHAILRGTDGYLNPGACNVEAIEEAINTHLIKHYEFLQKTYHYYIQNLSNVYVVPELSNYRKGVCTHYDGGRLTTFQGLIALNSSVEMMQMLYDFGIGVRTGQGFGLLDFAN